MTILFMGGEPEDFTAAGITSFNTSSGYRPPFMRGIIAIAGATGSAYLTAGFTASAAFSFTCRFYLPTGATAAPWLSFNTGGNQRLRLKSAGNTPTTIALETYNGTSAVTLATSTLTINNSTSYKLDVIIDYQTVGRVRVYIDQVLWIDFSGNPIVASATSLDSVTMQPHYGAGTFNSHYGEVIVATQDTRALSLVTLAPNAAGTANSWTSGAYTDIDDLTASDLDVMVSATANQVANVNLTGMPTGWSNLSVVAVKAQAVAARGTSGPSKLAMGVRTNSADSFPTATTLETGYATVSTTYELNPVTGVAWTSAEIDALQLAFRSET